jgi:hypothetical protein
MGGPTPARKPSRDHAACRVSPATAGPRQPYSYNAGRGPIIQAARQDVFLRPGDIFLTRGRRVASWFIRFLTRRVGEERTKVNHVGLVVERGFLAEAIVVEALMRSGRVKQHRLWEEYGPPCRDAVAVYRPINLSEREISAIVARVQSYVGKRYGCLKIAAHLLDWLCLGAYLFRRMVPDGDYPICSWVVADAYASVGKHFGVLPGAATPDDIWDFVAERKPSYFVQVRPLVPLREE